MDHVQCHADVISFDLLERGERIAFTMDPHVATLMDKRAINPASALIALAVFANGLDLLATDMVAAGPERHITVGLWTRWVQNGGRL